MMKLLLKKRLQAALELMPSHFEVFYDLFCDHGLLGQAAKKKFSKKVIFNDCREGIINRLKESLLIIDEEIEFSKAQMINLHGTAGVFMLGVGGHLIKECLSTWEKENQDNLYGGHSFVLGPHYYHLELKEYLRALGAVLIDQRFVFERGEGYELYLIQFSKDYIGVGKNVLDFDENFWSGVVKEEPGAIKYLRKKAESFSRIKKPNSHQFEYASSLARFMAKINGKI